MKRSQRAPSVILLSDHEDDDNHPIISTQFATPMAQINHHHTTDMKSECIDFDSPTKSPIGLAQRDYLPYTLTSLNQERLTILPMYPINESDVHDKHSDDDDVDEQPRRLLLANLPDNQLSNEERKQRRPGKYKCQFSISESTNDHTGAALSFMAQQYRTYFSLILPRFNMDLSILDFNYLRLKKFIQLCQLSYIRFLPPNRSTDLDFHLQENEYPQLLEFFLQIDIDLFYMKTCSYRQAIPRMEHEGIFCQTTPECLYVMQPCGNCQLCYYSSVHTNVQQSSPYSIAFNLYQKHRFVNGYESILNCPATCQTNNIIYALTCQCGHYDYIGETNSNLFKRLSSHHCFIHRLILDTLIGKKNYEKYWPGGGIKTYEMNKKDSMRLYQHPMRCSSVIQAFLNQNVAYWIFVPMSCEDADRENLQYQSSTTTTTTTVMPIPPNDPNTQKFLSDRPKPPVGYKFSILQIQKQSEFFIQQRYLFQTHTNYAVYHATLIAVLPLNTSDLFRRIIHSLLVTHAETKLNVLGHAFPYPLKAPLNEDVWCANLQRRPLPPTPSFRY